MFGFVVTRESESQGYSESSFTTDPDTRVDSRTDPSEIEVVRVHKQVS